MWLEDPIKNFYGCDDVILTRDEYDCLIKELKELKKSKESSTLSISDSVWFSGSTYLVDEVEELEHVTITEGLDISTTDTTTDATSVIDHDWGFIAADVKSARIPVDSYISVEPGGPYVVLPGDVKMEYVTLIDRPKRIYYTEMS